LAYAGELTSYITYVENLDNSTLLKKIDSEVTGTTFLTKLRLRMAALREKHDLDPDDDEDLPDKVKSDLKKSAFLKTSYRSWDNVLKDKQVDVAATTNWLAQADLPPQTEAMIFAIRGEAVTGTRAFRHKIGAIADPTCRFCGVAPETASHLVSGCQCFNFNRYLARHDQVCRAIYWTLLGHIGAPRARLWWKQQCKPFLTYAGHKITWNQSLTCQDTSAANRPDVIWTGPKDDVKVIEVSCPRDGRVGIANNEKREKYVPLLTHLQKRHKGWVDFVPVIIGGTGAVTLETKHAVTRMNIGLELPWLQKIAATATVNLFRQLL
jgi:hypothetical protein